MSEHDCTTAQANELTAEYLRSVLHYDQETGIFTWKISNSNRVKVGDVAGCPNGDGYLRIKVCSRKYTSHRLAWLYVHGTWPTEEIDHVNRDRTDNRRVNLREVSHKQNLQNASKRSDNKSGHPGVYWNKRISKWRAYITHNQKRIYLGYYNTIEEAIAARKAGELKYWGVNRAE